MSAIVEYSQTEAALQELSGKYKGVIYDVTVTQGMKDALAARAELRSIRVDLEKKRVEFKAPALERCKMIDSEAKRITTEIVSLENPIDGQIKAEERRKEEIKEAKAAVERNRIAEIQSQIAIIRNFPAKLSILDTLPRVAEALVLVNGIEVGDEFQEFQEEAEQAKKDAIATIERLEAEVRARVENEERLAAERAEIERLQAQQRAEIERLQEQQRQMEAKLKAEQDEINRQKRENEAVERRIKEQQETIEREKREQQEAAEREKAEADRKEQAKADHVKALSEARRDTPEQALFDILSLANDLTGNPYHQKVRIQIALIAEATLAETTLTGKEVA